MPPNLLDSAGFLHFPTALFNSFFFRFYESQQNGFKTEIALQAGTEQFHRAAVKIKRKKVWENMKMKIIIGVIISVIIIIIIIMATSG